jgi:glucokinase
MAPAVAPRSTLAVDIGGTKLAAAVVAEDGTLLARRQVATPRGDGERLYMVVRSLALEAASEAGRPLDAIGVGCPGPMRYPEGVVSPLNMPAWREFPLKARLEREIELPCAVDNDAKAIALGEHWRGAGAGIANLMGMVVSTGVGGGIILDGRLLHGGSGNAGHIGHVVVWPDGPLCECGARGCLEAIASGTSIARRAAALVTQGSASTLPAAADAAEIATCARAGDSLARRLYEEAGAAIGRAVASAAALLDLELVAIGGSVALRAWDLLNPPLQAELRRSAQLDFSRGVRVVQAQLGDDASLIGAAALGFGLIHS